MSAPETFKNYLVEYSYEGSRWGFYIHATSHDDAKRRVKALGFAVVQGEVAAKIPVPGSSVVRLFLRWLFGARHG